MTAGVVEVSTVFVLAVACALLVRGQRRTENNKGDVTASRKHKRGKIDSKGHYLPFPGTTIVWPVQTTCPGPAKKSDAVICTSWSQLPQAIQGILGSAYTALPASSYHVTLLDIVTLDRLLSASSVAPAPHSAVLSPSSQTWQHYLKTQGARLALAREILQKATLSDSLVHANPPRSLRYSKVAMLRNCVAVEFLLSDEAEAVASSALEKQLLRALDISQGRVWPFHVTVAYRRPGETADLSHHLNLVEAAVLGALGGCEKRLTLEPAVVSEFADMTAFPPWVRGGNVGEG